MGVDQEDCHERPVLGHCGHCHNQDCLTAFAIMAEVLISSGAITDKTGHRQCKIVPPKPQAGPGLRISASSVGQSMCR